MKQKILKRIMMIMLIMVLFIISIMVITVPSEEKLNGWIAETYGIECDEYYNSCYKENEKIYFTSSRIKSLMIFNSYQMNFEYENDEQVTIRILGIFGAYFEMSAGRLWEILN